MQSTGACVSAESRPQAAGRCGRRSCTRRQARPREPLGLAADDQPDQILEVGLADPALGHLQPLVHDAMRSQTRNRSCSRWVIRTTRDAARPRRRISAQHRLDLGHRQRRGRLVHDQDLRRRRRRRGRWRSIAAGRRRAADECAEIGDVDVEAVSMRARLLAHARLVEEAAARGCADGSRPRNRLPATSIVSHRTGPGRPSRSGAPAPPPASRRRTGWPSIAIVPASGT